MDLLIRTEAERIAKIESEERRKLRIVQVRKQTTGWSKTARKRYEAEKSDQLNKIIDEATVKRKEEAVEAIKEMTKEHMEGMHQIGAAHRAAEFINQMNLPQKEKAEKIQRDKTAFRRHISAINAKREREATANVTKLQPRLRKEDVRQKENMVAKELVLTQPYRARTAGVVQDKSREKVYHQSPIKYLDFPSAQKSPKKKRRSKFDAISEVKKPPAKEPKKPSPSAFDIAARDRAAGVTPEIATKFVIYKDTSCRTDFQKGDHREINEVTYFDASIPLPPIRYQAPPGLVQQEIRESVKCNAWVDGENLKDDAQRMRKQLLLDSIEMERKAKIRGKKALKIAKLEQRYKRLETDLLGENQMQVFEPVLASLLGLPVPQEQDRPDHKNSQDKRTSTSAEGASTSGYIETSVSASATANFDQKSVRWPESHTLAQESRIMRNEFSDSESSIHTISWSPTPQSSPSHPHSEETSPEASSGATHSWHTTSSSNGSTMAVVEIMCSPGRKPHGFVVPSSSPSAELLLSDALNRVLFHQIAIQQGDAGEQSENHSHVEELAPSYSHSEDTSPETASGAAPSVKTSSSSNSSTMAVVEIMCSPGREPRGSVVPSSPSAELLLSDAVNRILLHQRGALQRWCSTGRQLGYQPHEASPSSTLSSTDTSASFVSPPGRIPRPGRENVIPRFQPPSSISSIRSDSSRDLDSKETNRGTFGRNLSNTLVSSSRRSEQHTGELPTHTSAIQKLANEWTQLSIEKPPWWQ